MFKKYQIERSAFETYFCEADEKEDDDVSVTVAPRKNRGNDYGDDNTNVTVGPRSNRGNDYNNDDEDTGDEEAPDEPDTGDGGTDYSSDNEDEDDTTDDTGDEEDSNTEDDKDEKLKKFHTYKRYVHLYNILGSFIDKLQTCVKDDATQNAVIKTINDNLNDIRNNMFDFMTVKYKSSSYIQVLIYFETVISAIRLNFELMRNNKIKIKQ